MPTSALRWPHVIVNTHCSWLHGDARGFRSRGHRIHSSGDYRNPPPAGEHLGLFLYHVGKDGGEVHIPSECRAAIGRAMLVQFRTLGYRVLGIAVAKVHAHGLVELPDDIRVVRAVVGEAKRVSSRAVKDALPGSVWGAGGTYKPVDNPGHRKASHDYIIYDQGPDAWTWSHLDGSDEGQFRRKRPALPGRARRERRT